MKRTKARFLKLLASLVVATAALAAVQCGPRDEASDFARQFASPGTDVQPRLRWWWPGAHVDHEELVREVHEIADAGFGGVEIADVYDSVHDPMDPAIYGWGTDLWNEAVAVVLEAAKERGLVVDGVIWPIALFTRTDRGVRVDISLAPGEATIVAVGDGETLGGVPGEGATQTTADELVREGGRLAVRDREAGRYTTTFASGERVSSEITHVPEPMALDEWTLSVEAWGPGGSATETSKERLQEITLDKLRPWMTIEGLEHVSGVATYSTTVTFEEGWTGGYGAYLELGESVDTVRVRVNGQSVGPVDQIDSVVDVGPYLTGDANTVEVEVATSLANQLLGVRPELAAGPERRSAPGGGPGGPPRRRRGPEPQGYGLLGPVVLQPYGQVSVRDR